MTSSNRHTTSLQSALYDIACIEAYGRPSPEVAAELGLHQKTVRNIWARLRREGVLTMDRPKPPPKPRKPRHPLEAKFRSAGLKGAALKQALEAVL